eukprot:EG_transcript_2729
MRLCGWLRRRVSLPILVLVLSPTAVVLVTVALVAWFMIYSTAFQAIEAVGHQGQQIFVEAMRESILEYTGIVHRFHTSNVPRWNNTACEGTPPAGNVSAFAPYADVRLTLWSQVHNVPEGASSMGVAFAYGSYLGYQRSSQGLRWSIIDDSTAFWMRKVVSETWQDCWDKGPETMQLPGGAPINITKRIWFTDAVRTGKQAWSAIYLSFRGEFALPAVLPVYHPDGRLKLVAEADFSIQRLDAFLTHLKLTSNTFAFVAELDGNLVASTPEGLSTAMPQQQSASGVALRVAAQQAGDARLAGAAQWLVRRFGSFLAVPVNDSGFVVWLHGQSHYLFTGHVQDRYGLHWVIVIGLPQSDLLGGLDAGTATAISVIAATLLASGLLIGTVALSVRRHLRLFAQHIKRVGAMDLEGAKMLEGAVFLSETCLILMALKETIYNLRQFRAFLPCTMLDKVRQAEREEAEEASPASPPQSPSRAHPSHPSHAGLPRPPYPLGCSLTPDSAAQHPPQSLVRCMLERRMDRVAVTLVSLQLPHLHSAQPAAWPTVDFMEWYEACLGTALGLVQLFQGDFYRLMGEQLVFSWGAVRRGESQCASACRAAWQLQRTLQDWDTRNTRPVKYSPRMSIVTGPALCGVMGTATTRDLYLVGPLIQRASLLAAPNCAGHAPILVDGEVAKQCATTFQTQKVMKNSQQPHRRPSCQVCKEVFDAELPGQHVYELLGPIVDEGAATLATDEDAWMYRTSAPEGGQNDPLRALHA